jgi:hypothetical protein
MRGREQDEDTAEAYEASAGEYDRALFVPDVRDWTTIAETLAERLPEHCYWNGWWYVREGHGFKRMDVEVWTAAVRRISTQLWTVEGASEEGFSWSSATLSEIQPFRASIATDKEIVVALRAREGVIKLEEPRPAEFDHVGWFESRLILDVKLKIATRVLQRTYWLAGGSLDERRLGSALKEWASKKGAYLERRLRRIDGKSRPAYVGVDFAPVSTGSTTYSPAEKPKQLH